MQATKIGLLGFVAVAHVEARIGAESVLPTHTTTFTPTPKTTTNNDERHGESTRQILPKHPYYTPQEYAAYLNRRNYLQAQTNGFKGSFEDWNRYPEEPKNPNFQPKKKTSFHWNHTYV